MKRFFLFAVALIASASLFAKVPVIGVSGYTDGSKNMVNKTYKYIILGDEKELDMEALGKIGPIHRLSTEQIFGY